MRTSQRKSLKRGRKPGKNKAKGKDSKTRKAKKTTPKNVTSKGKKERRRNIWKSTSQASFTPEQLGEEAPASTESNKSRKPPAKAEPKSKAMAKAKAKPAHKARSKSPKVANTEAKVYQNRLQDGKRWVYEILPNQVYGCKTCRFIFGGCKTCRKEGFRGTSAAVARPLQGGVLVEPAQRGLRRRGKGAAGTSKCRKTEAE